MTKIVHVTDATIAGVNGIAASIRLLARTLARRGHDSLVVSAGPLWGARRPGAAAGPLWGSGPLSGAGSPGGAVAGPEVIWAPSMPTGMGDFRFVLFPIGAMRDPVRAWRPDVVHVHTPGPLGAAGLTVARQLGIPAVYTYQTDMLVYSRYYHFPTAVIRAGTAVYARHLRRGATTRRAGRYGAVEAANARVFEAAEVIIAPTAGALRRCRITAYADKVRVIATPADPVPAGDGGVDGADGADFRDRFGIAPDRPVVLFVGRLSAEKGIRLLLDAFALLRSRLPRTALVLVGPTSRRLRLPRLLDRAGLTAHTVVTGALGGAEVQAAYRAGTVFAFPSATDTQGIVLHEAALAGLPIVMTDRALHGSHPLAGAMRVTDATPAAFAEGLSALLLAPDEAAALGRRGRGTAREYTPEEFGDEMVRAYDDARRTPPPRPIVGVEDR